MGSAIYRILVMYNMESDLSSLQVRDVHPSLLHFTIRNRGFGFSHDIKCKSQATMWWVYLCFTRKSA